MRTQKVFLLSFLTAFLLQASFALNAEAACQGGYPMVCKAPLMESFSIDVNIFRIYFNKGNVSAKSDFTDIARGTCAWIDRPVNNSEPQFIAGADIDGQFNLNTAQIAQYTAMATAITSAILVPDTLLYFNRVCNDSPKAQFLNTDAVPILPPGTKGLPPGYRYQ